MSQMREFQHPEPAEQGQAGNPLQAGKREVDLYIQTYMTLLRSSGPVAVDTLTQAHLNIGSSLHDHAGEPTPDMNAFMYSTMRLPPEIVSVESILLGQSRSTFARNGYPDLESWASVSAPGRRRRWFHDGGGILAVYVGSTSDLDDLIPTIVAWQIEWNKFHRTIRGDEDLKARINRAADEPELEAAIREQLHIEESDWLRLKSAWGEQFWPNLQRMATGKRDIHLQMLGGTYLGFARSTRHWWAPVDALLAERGLLNRPVYFVSSNTHSIANILTGTATRRKDELIRFIEETGHPELLPELRMLQGGETMASWENFLYYAARSYFRLHRHERVARDLEEKERGFHSIEPESVLDVGSKLSNSTG